MAAKQLKYYGGLSYQYLGSDGGFITKTVSTFTDSVNEL